MDLVLHFCRHALINCCHCSESATKRPIELLKIAKSCGLCLGIYLQIMFAYFSTCLLYSIFIDNYIFSDWKESLHFIIIIYLKKCVVNFKWQKDIKNYFLKRFTASWSFLLKMQFFIIFSAGLFFRLRQHFGESSMYIIFFVLFVSHFKYASTILANFFSQSTPCSWYLLSERQIDGEDFVSFCAFLQKMNFIINWATFLNKNAFHSCLPTKFFRIV